MRLILCGVLLRAALSSGSLYRARCTCWRAAGPPYKSFFWIRVTGFSSMNARRCAISRVPLKEWSRDSIIGAYARFGATLAGSLCTGARTKSALSRVCAIMEEASSSTRRAAALENPSRPCSLICRSDFAARCDASRYGDEWQGDKDGLHASLLSVSDNRNRTRLFNLNVPPFLRPSRWHSRLIPWNC
ncbi:hypothetical protein C8R45DRAFT_638743 [Mycena sanguinolenta]|nr:hypothetical protein C8R45DRAFT_638743 [Mycena sanguinolenta]